MTRSMLRRPFAPLAALLAITALAAACAPDDTRGALHVVTIDRPINHVLDRYIERTLDHAEETNARAVLVRVDTPGGELEAMKRIVGRIENAGVPVITWVGPAGAQAVSAGTFVTMAGHVAAMAPNTTIGAATPITATGEDVEGALGRKVTNDTVAFARGVADLHGRNADWAEEAVREARSATPDEAVELNVVDLIAATEAALLEAIEGREVTLIGGSTVELQLASAPRVENEFNPYERVLAIVSDPLIVSLLLLVGMIGLATEFFFAPGSFLPGTAGAIALLLAFLGLGTLLPGETALALVGLAAALIVLELFIPTGGILGAGAAIALAIAVGIWIGGGGTEVGIWRVLTVVLGTIIAITLLVGAFVGVIALRYLAPTRKPGEDTRRPEGYQ